jgi:signal transduction histidine kinase
MAGRQLALAARTARENLEETRAVVGAVAPRPLTDTSLETALRQVTVRFSTDTDIPASFEVEGPARTVSAEVGAILLRVTQESLTNVREHAGAHRARVRLAFEPGSVVVEVRDDGSGFDLDALSSLDVNALSENGLGSMRNRVEKIGGRLTVHSALVEGTVVRTEFAD